LHGRYDNRDMLIEGLMGPVLAERTYLEAVAEGAICPIHVYMLKIPIPILPRKSRNQAMKTFLFESQEAAALTKRICKEVFPDAWQTLVFIKNEKQADLYMRFMGGEEYATVAMAKKMSTKQRKSLFARMQSGEILRCLATNIYAQGVTFSDMRVCINCESGGPYTQAVQKPGRLAEIIEGKPFGVLVDYMFVPSNMGPEELEEIKAYEYAALNLVNDAARRRKVYVDKGYVVKDVTFQELKDEFAQFKS
jgi:superfamily II DNA or RNA helicase